MKLFYKSSDGTIFDLMDGDITCDTPETLLKRKWKYKTVSAVNGFSKIKSFYKETEEYQLTISLLCDNKAEFNKLTEKLLMSFEKDITTMQPGRIYWNDYYKEVFCIITEPSDFEEYLESVEQKLTLLCLYDYWIKDSTVNFSSGTEIDFNFNADFPFEFGNFEFMPTEYLSVLDTQSNDESHFKILFFGPCSNPYITIGGNEYRLKNCALSDGEYIVIDSKSRTIYKYSKSGEKENILHLRFNNRIFDKLPAGKSKVTKPNDLQVQVTAYTERSEPVWI